MRKVFLVFALICAHKFANAQEIGVRFGNVAAVDFAVDGVFLLGKFSRVHADIFW